MFVGDQQGKAEEAITFYTSLFENSQIVSVERYGAGENEPEGTVKVAKFTLNGVEHMWTVRSIISLHSLLRSPSTSNVRLPVR